MPEISIAMGAMQRKMEAFTGFKFILRAIQF
jgi:hypothetical protein